MGVRPAAGESGVRALFDLARRRLDRAMPEGLAGGSVVRDEALGSILYDTAVPAAVEAVLPDDSSEWPLPSRTAAFLARLIEVREIRRVLEFGAGSSSVVIARALSATGGTLTSLESDPEWCSDRWAQVAGVSAVDSRLLPSRLALDVCHGGIVYVYERAAAALPGRGPFELVLVDAPQSWYGRAGALYSALPHLAPGALIVMDDAGREGERNAIAGWLRTCPGLRLAVFDPDYGRLGVAVLVYDGVGSNRWDTLTMAGSVLDAVRNARLRRRHRPVETVAGGLPA